MEGIMGDIMESPTAAPRKGTREDTHSPLVRLRGIEKSFDHGAGRFHVLRRVDLDVVPGDFVSVMGPSGAGKSTLLHLIGLQDGDWTGEYQLEGTDVGPLDGKARGRLRNELVGFVFQSYHLLDDLTVAENLEVPLSYRAIKKPERESMVAETLDRFGLAARARLYPRQLSGGQQQLVGIARALVARPKLLLADEPTGNLHSDQAREIMRLFQELNAQGTTIVQVTHSEENARYGRRVIHLVDGWVDREDQTDGGRG
jgi:ABC-type lipoprotein export system ATPase subunit